MKIYDQVWVVFHGERFLIRKLPKGAVAFDKNGRYFWRSTSLSGVKKACKARAERIALCR